MHIIRAPRVTLIARQQFLPPEHIRWQSDSTVPGEALAEFAGRLCFDDKTEVLTRNGWRLFQDLNGDEEVLTRNPRSGAAEYQRPIMFHRFPYNDELYCAEGRDISFAVTPEHRQFGRFMLPSRRLGEYEFVRTDDIGSRVFAIECAAEGWTGEYPDAVELPAVSYSQRLANAAGEYGTRETAVAARPLMGHDQMAALAQLCTYYATEGSLSRQTGSGQGIVIYGNHVASVVALCNVMGLPHSIWTDPRNGVERVIIGGGIQWRTFFEQECGRGSPNKKLPRWVLDLPTEQLREIWNILVRTDGHTYASGRQILVTTSPELAGQCQEILCKIGHKSIVTRQANSQGTNYPTYVVSRKSPKPALINRHVPIRRVPYQGDVFCVSVGNGTVFVRRDGKPHFSGNCYLSFGEDAGLEGGHRTISGRTSNEAYLGNILQVKHGSVLEHAVFTFLIEGVSRSLTHELVRHRAGMAYCLSGDTLVYSEHRDGGRRNGTKKRTLRSIYEMTQTPHGRSRLKLLRLRSLDQTTGTFTDGRVRAVVCSGSKPVFRVELEDGKSITCTKEHRFLTPNDGWKPLAEIVGGLEVSAGGLAVYGRADASLLVNGVAAYRDPAWLREQYHERSLPQETIAQLAGVSHHTIRAWVRKHGLQKPIGSWTVGVSPWNRGNRYRAGWTHSEETRRLLGEMKRDEANPHWKGGITPEGVRLRRPPRSRGNVLVPHAVRIRSVTYEGEQMTYDLEMEGPHHNFVANGIVTHNSQLSQRYVDESDIGFVVPPEIDEGTEAYRAWEQACEGSLQAYRRLLDEMGEVVGDSGPATMRKKRARQAARSVLPNCAETKLVMTGNARAWRHFVEMRGSATADVEIRRLAGAVLGRLRDEAPHIFGDMHLVPHNDGTATVETPNSKV
jgi:thymidylate synthase ThyX